MAYVPTDDDAFRSPVAGNSSAWTSLIDNDRECFALYSPGMEANPKKSASAVAREYRFRQWGNYDNAQLTVGVRAVGVTGPHTVTVATPGVDSDTVSVSTDQWYEVAVDAVGPTQEVIVSSAALGGGTLAYTGIRSRLTPGSASTTRYASGFRKVGLVWYTSGHPVPSEIVSRLRTNPIRLAKDRPVCVFAHLSDTVASVTAKAPDVWGAYDSTQYSRVGGGIVPRCDIGPRWYRVDAYTTETTPGLATFAVQIGGSHEEWSGVGWHSWRIKDGAGPLEVWGSVLPGTGNGAAIRSLLVWRTEL